MPAPRAAPLMNPAVKCPTCGRRGDWFGAPFGPFCSKRCRLIDLGKWFGGEHAISEPLRPEHLAALEETDRPEQEQD